MTEPRFPQVKVTLSGTDGNAIIVVGKVGKAIDNGLRPTHSYDERVALVKEFRAEALSGDYDYVLQTCMKWVDVS
jgi:hypothetical protein